MPYIKSENRDTFDRTIQQLVEQLGESPNFEGNLNYIISKLIDELCVHHQGYAQINRVVGVLECAKLEFYRRIAVGYEDKKIRENGEVYYNTF